MVLYLYQAEEFLMDNRDSILQQLDDIKLRVEQVTSIVLMSSTVDVNQILDEYDPHHTCSLNTRKSVSKLHFVSDCIYNQCKYLPMKSYQSYTELH